ncbi:hypothetical protein Hanom_Chr03g00240281 [Helianthus anomalus]
MPMMWRALYTVEQIISNEGIDFNMSELSYYSLVTHGSHRFLFKAKPHQPLQILKTIKNDTTLKNQFFFVRRDSTPLGDSLPKKWILKVNNFACLADLPGTEERIAAFWAIDSTIRTFKPKIKELEETSSTSYTMSSVLRSTSNSASKFGLDDIDSMISHRSIKKELAKGQSLPEPKIVTTRAKVGSKRKKPSEP